MKYSLVRTAAAVPLTTVGNLEKNTDVIIDMIADLEKKDVNIAAFPELCITSYTMGDLFRQSEVLKQAEECLFKILSKTKSFKIISIIGMPIIYQDKLFNVAAVIKFGKVLGIIPKAFIPNYSEYYEVRWFTGGGDIKNETFDLRGEQIPFGVDLLFECEEYKKFTFGVEVCEDLWAPFPPHAYQAMAGSFMCFNISASNELVGKADYRKEMVRHQSARYISCYTYVSAGCGESTTDTVFGGHALLAENGKLLGETKRFSFENEYAITEFDIERLVHDRILRNTFDDEGERKEYRRISFSLENDKVLPKYREMTKMPFVPYFDEDKTKRCEEVFDIQVTALSKRMKHAHINKLVIGVSGGLDSTLALLVAREAVKRCGLKPNAVLGVVMPGFGSTGETQELARRLVASLKAELREISIEKAARGHLEDINHPLDKRDITYENAQARERTQILMDLANQQSGMVVGTGDLSELALGFCTYAGDQISMYGVNAGIAKTLIKEIVLIRAKTEESDVYSIIKEIVSIPPSPELLPSDATKDIRQDTQKQIGAYNLNDFFMYYVLRFQMAPKKILELAVFVYGDEYSKIELKDHLKNFYSRFFRSQFKRSCMPDGPKVGSVSLSPRGDWRMPSDADAEMWIKSLD
jgi:NAD+ synthase (glutamine-hydrolysing)